MTITSRAITIKLFLKKVVGDALWNRLTNMWSVIVGESKGEREVLVSMSLSNWEGELVLHDDAHCFCGLLPIPLLHLIRKALGLITIQASYSVRCWSRLSPSSQQQKSSIQEESSKRKWNRNRNSSSSSPCFQLSISVRGIPGFQCSAPPPKSPATQFLLNRQGEEEEE
uniref:Uncharacterized protein n=1 Tax=Ditylenchus dipsaci TaxID=166011 RepID=A0A915EBQ7_9BILA